jgi:hypothetical protein
MIVLSTFILNVNRAKADDVPDAVLRVHAAVIKDAQSILKMAYPTASSVTAGPKGGYHGNVEGGYTLDEKFQYTDSDNAAQSFTLRLKLDRDGAVTSVSELDRTELWPTFATGNIMLAVVKSAAQEIIPLVEGVLRKNGITVADIMPALKRGRYTPPEDYQYEIFAQPVTRYIGVEYGRIITAIGKDVDLCGTLCNSFGSDATRDAHIKNHGLSLILARNLPEQQISS